MEPTGSKESFLQSLRDLILQNLENEQFGVEGLADLVGISRSQLHRRVRRQAHLTIIEFIRNVRLEEAMKLLLEGDNTAAEVAYKTGFSSPSYFNKCFHDQYGCPPGEVKKLTAVGLENMPIAEELHSTNFPKGTPTKGSEQNPFPDFPGKVTRGSQQMKVPQQSTPGPKRYFSLTITRTHLYSLAAVLVVVLIAYLGIKFRRYHRNREALNQTIPALRDAVKQVSNTDGKKFWDLYARSLALPKKLRKSPEFIRLWDDITYPLTIRTNVPGAGVYGKPYADPDTSWHFFGKTPLTRYSFPRGLSRIKIEKQGYETQYDVVLKFFIEPPKDESLHYHLCKPDEMPNDMVYVTGQVGDYWTTPSLPPLYIADFWMDRYEVTNAVYQVFMDSGGYSNPVYWKTPFVEGEDTLLFDDALKKFTDKTGWPGPANWELGEFPYGESDVPVTGISWYEAAAYAVFSKKALPTLFHWEYVSQLHATSEIVKFGNYEKKGPAGKQTYNSMTRYGTFDLPGNVSEWIYNAVKNDRYIVGGNYQEPTYWYNRPIAISPWSRSELVGFRCIRYLYDTLRSQLQCEFDRQSRDLDNLRPVPDEIFEVYRELLVHESEEVNSELVSSTRTEKWIREIIAVDVPYADEPMPILVYLPMGFDPPYQTVVYFPGLDSHWYNSIEEVMEINIDFLLKKGRALIWPIYYSTHGRGPINITNIDLWDDSYRNIITDFQIAVDYLETRPDIDAQKLAYYGKSWGAQMAPFILSIEERIKVGILALFGTSSKENFRLVGFDQVDYIPHVRIPMLLLGGRYDFSRSMEQQQAFYDLLGTPEEDKRWILYESTHNIPSADLFNESHAWLDRYFGTVAIPE